LCSAVTWRGVVSCWGRGVPWELWAMAAPARDRLLNPACDSEAREAKQRAAKPGFNG
jgi:hypothetical protein